MVTSDFTSGDASKQPHVVARSDLEMALDLADYEPLFEELRKYNHTGRPPYDIRSMWRATLTKYLLGLRYNVELVALLRSDDAVRTICGFDGEPAPSESMVSRFYKRLSEHQGLVDDALHGLVDRVAEAIDERRKPNEPRPGEAMAIDSTDIQSFSDVKIKPSIDRDAAWGHRTPKHAINKSRSDGKKDEFFFGFKMHTVCDAHWGFPVDYLLLPANRSDSPTLPGLTDQVVTRHPNLKLRYMTGDRGYDAASNYVHLDRKRILSVIHRRDTDKGDIYAVSGSPTCVGGEEMEYVGTDQEKGHLFRCRSEGCRLRDRMAVTTFCDSEHYEDPRGNPELLRKVGRLPRASYLWKKLYAKRTSIERLFRSLKASRILDLHHYRGLRKVTLHAALSNLTYLATMLTRVMSGDMEGMRKMRLKVE